MKLKKFVVSIVASALVVASMATTVLAAQSPTTEDVTPVITQTPSGGGNANGGQNADTSKSGGTSSGSTSSRSTTSSGSSTSSRSNEAATFASNISGDIIKYDGSDVDAYAAVLKQLSNDIIASARALGTGGILKAVDVADPKNHGGSITIKFKSSAFKAGMKITALHLPDGSSTWEKLKPDSVSDGECVVTFPNGLSPVVFTAEGVSDKTGETAPILPILAVICLAGAVFFGTKMRFAK